MLKTVFFRAIFGITKEDIELSDYVAPLHKLKDLNFQSDNASVVFTCSQCHFWVIESLEQGIINNSFNSGSQSRHSLAITCNS